MTRGGLVLALLIACAGPGCGGAGTAATTGVAKDSAVVRFDTPIRDAEVWVDGRFYAGALRGGIEVPAGSYRIEIRHDDYHTMYLELTLAKGQRRVVPVRMARKLD